MPINYSIIIPAYNEELLLVNSLESLQIGGERFKDQNKFALGRGVGQKQKSRLKTLTGLKAVKCILLLVLMQVSYAASADAPVFATTTQSNYARKFVPPKGKAVVYIYQRRGDGKGVSPTIWLNKYKVGRLVPGAFTVLKLSPGRLKIRVNANKPAHLSIVAKAGKIYRFRLSVTQTAAGSRARLIEYPRSDMASTRWIRNPRTVTSVATRSPGATKRARAKPVRKSRRNRGQVVVPGDIGLMFKVGALTLSEDTQMITGANRRFDNSVSGLYAIEAYYQFDTGLTLGGEIMHYTTEFTTVGFNDRHDVDVIVLMANTKKYFHTSSRLQPFIGVGIGFASTNISGPAINGYTYGLAYQLMAGVEYRGTNMGVFGEVKYVGADTESKYDVNIDVSGIGIFAGIAFHF